MPLPPWIADHPRKDNWLTVAKVRAQTEAANSPSGKASPADDESHTTAALPDDPHEF
jgi:hypothetical protein